MNWCTASFLKFRQTGVVVTATMLVTIAATTMVALEQGFSIGLPLTSRVEFVEQADQVIWNVPTGSEPRSATQEIRVDRAAATTFYAMFVNFTADPVVPPFKEGDSLPAFPTGGYVGTQTNGSTGDPRNLIFSIWGATAAEPGPGTRCSDWFDDPRNPTLSTNSGEGGFGFSCPLPYFWAEANAATVNLSWDGIGTGPNRSMRYQVPPGEVPTAIVEGSWWKGTFTQSGMVTTIARIFVPGTTHRISRLTNFIESFGGNERCSDPTYRTTATFFVPSFDGVVATNRTATGVAQQSPCESQTLWQSDGSTIIDVRPGAAALQEPPLPTSTPSESVSPTVGTFSVTPRLLAKGDMVQFTWTGLTPQAGRVDLYIGDTPIGTVQVDANGAATRTMQVWIAGKVRADWVRYDRGNPIVKSVSDALVFTDQPE